MEHILKELMSQLGDKELDAIGQQAGVDKGQAANALEGIMPTLLGAMANNTQDQSGANSFLSALDRDHDGSILDDIAGYVGTGSAGNAGKGILKHVLGDNQQAVESQLGNKSGLSADTISKLLQVAAPLVMGYLGKQKRQSGGFDASDIGGLLGNLAGQANKDSSFDLDDIFSMVTKSGNKKGGDIGGIAGSLLGGLFK